MARIFESGGRREKVCMDSTVGVERGQHGREKERPVQRRGHRTAWGKGCQEASEQGCDVIATSSLSVSLSLNHIIASLTHHLIGLLKTKLCRGTWVA